MVNATSAATGMPLANRLIAIVAKPEALGAIILLAVVIAFQALSGGILLSPYNVSNVLTVLPEIGLVVIGVSILMIAGEFDLSVGSVFALTPMVAFTLADSGLPIGLTLCIAMACALLVGLINGYITQVYHLPSFITTLGMLFVVRSLTVSVSGGFPPPFAADAPTYLFSDFVGPVRISMIWFFVIFAIAAFGLRSTNYGVWTYATGGQKEVAKSVGINTLPPFKKVRNDLTL